MPYIESYPAKYPKLTNKILLKYIKYIISENMNLFMKICTRYNSEGYKLNDSGIKTPVLQILDLSITNCYCNISMWHNVKQVVLKLKRKFE